jgi:ribosomal protein L33
VRRARCARVYNDKFDEIHEKATPPTTPERVEKTNSGTGRCRTVCRVRYTLFCAIKGNNVLIIDKIGLKKFCAKVNKIVIQKNIFFLGVILILIYSYSSPMATLLPQ